MGIDHGIFADVRADIDEHGWHTDYAAGDEAAVADAGAAGNDADAVGGGDSARRVGGLVEEWLLPRVERHVRDLAHAEAEENALFYPRLGAPAARC